MRHTSYPGGKAGSGVYQAIINQIPPHRVYLEPFLGGGAVMRRKLPADINVGVDIDPAVVAVAAAGHRDGVWCRRDPGAGRWSFEVADAVDYLEKRRWGTGEFVYCDPPYLVDTRSCHRPMYRYELEPDWHRELLRVLLAIPATVMVSGYESTLYKTMLASWRTTTYQTVNRRGRVVTEWLWMNYPAPVELHDYAFLGTDYRERERIRKRVRRWRSRLEALPPLERGALLQAMRARAQPGQPGP